MTKKSYILSIILLFFFILSNQITNAQNSTNNVSDNYAVSKREMKQRAKEVVNVLEIFINNVVQYGIEGKSDVDILIEKQIMPWFVLGATMQTCSKVDDKIVKVNTPKDYATYFYSLYQRARKCRSMKVEFTWVESADDVIRSKEPYCEDSYSYTCKIKFTQKYHDCKYDDETEKVVDIIFCKSGWEGYQARIGNCRVVR